MSNTLTALAEAAGLAPQYEDARGERQTIEPATLEAVLDRLGDPGRQREGAQREPRPSAGSRGGRVFRR
jgi:hypothetical protein